MGRYVKNTTADYLSRQVTNPDVIVSRRVDKHGTRVDYTFPLGFSITATKKGITFSGTSPNFAPETVQGVQRVIWWAYRIASQLKRDRGVMAQAELERTLKLRIRRHEDLVTAWFESYHEFAVTAKDGNEAVKQLRENWRQRAGRL